MPFDDSVGLAVQGYSWLPGLLRRAGGAGVARTRLLGQPVIGLRGPEAVRFFYDESHVRRAGAVPEPVQGTLFGHGAVHTLDGGDHRNRKLVFLSALKDPYRVAQLAEQAGRAWDAAAPGWVDRPGVVLFDETAQILTRAVCDWSGVPLADPDAPRTAADLTAMVDGFATAGPRHWRARRARGRLERWGAGLVERARADGTTDSVLGLVAHHTDTDGRLLTPELAAVELLNVLRPTVAVAWFAAFTGHALHRWPEQRDRLRAGGLGYAVAFAHEVRRFYPFAPFAAGRAVRDLSWRGVGIPANALVLLDIYGQNHDETLWAGPYRFDPGRFVDRTPARDELIPQGGGDPYNGHRCPGEDITIALLAALAPRLARLDYRVPEQDLSISLRRMPARPRSGVVLDVTGSSRSSVPVEIVRHAEPYR